MTAASLLAMLRSAGITTARDGDRILLRGAGARDHADAVRALRDEILLLLDADSFALIGESQPRSARWLQARFALNVAEQQHVFGYPREAARRRGYFDVLCEWVESDAVLRLMSSADAEPLARATLAELGIFDLEVGAL